MKNFIASLENKRAAAKANKDESGFSLIDVVVTVAIIVALSIGGFVAYSGIVANAKQAAVGSAADQVRTALVVADNDGDSATTHASVITAFNANSTGVTVAETGAAGATGTGYVTASSSEKSAADATKAAYTKTLQVN